MCSSALLQTRLGAKALAAKLYNGDALCCAVDNELSFRAKYLDQYRGQPEFGRWRQSCVDVADAAADRAELWAAVAGLHRMQITVQGRQSSAKDAQMHFNIRNIASLRRVLSQLL